MKTSDLVPLADILTKKLLPTSAVIVAMFILIWSLVGPMRNNATEHAEQLRQAKLTNKLIWGMCTNAAALIPDESMRLTAINRCAPDDKDLADHDQAYLFDGVIVQHAVAAKPRSSGVSSGSSSSSSAPVLYTARVAEANAERQNQERLERLSESGSLPPDIQ